MPFRTAALAAGLFVLAAPGAHAKGCTKAQNWDDCEPIAVDLAKVEFAGTEVKASTPTALVYGTLDKGGNTQLIVADKGGEVIAYDTKTGAQRTLLSLMGVASLNPERGLMGFALHPEWSASAQNRRFFTYHVTPRSPEANANCRPLPPSANAERLKEACAVGDQYGCGGSTVVTEWTVTDLAAPSKSLVARELLRRDQPGEGHNAGHLVFGPDGMLYVSIGDGGGQQDPCERGQDPSSVISSILRIDVDGDAVQPADNPFVGTEGHDPLIYAYGFRNPWRMDFVPEGLPGAGTMLVGDTGQARLEEIDVVVAGGNYGWSAREGTLEHPHNGDAPGPFMNPLYEYGNPKAPTGDAGGYAVVGGVTHPGADIPELKGYYVFGDNVTMKLYGLDLSAMELVDPKGWNGKAKVHLLKGASLPVATFARTPDGGVIVGASDGRIRRIVPAK